MAAVRNTLAAPLGAGAPFRLNQIPAEARLTELEFCFSLNSIQPKELARLFSELQLP